MELSRRKLFYGSRNGFVVVSYEDFLADIEVFVNVIDSKKSRVLARAASVLVSSFLYFFSAVFFRANAESFNITEENFTSRIYFIAFGVGIGSAIILIGVGGLQIALASGDPEKIQQGREQVVSAFIGLAVVVLSIVILRILGVDILGIDEGVFRGAGIGL